MQTAGNFATELKFALNTEMAAAVREWARTELIPDPHAADAEGDGYRTTSLYFDTEDLDVFFRRESNGRAKFRIRRYNDGPVLFVERKLKRAGLVTKRREKADQPLYPAVERGGNDRQSATLAHTTDGKIGTIKG